MRDVSEIIALRFLVLACGSEEALGLEHVRLGEVVGVVADGVLTYGDVVTGGNLLPVHDRATGADFAPECPRCGWCKAHCFFETSAEIVAGVEKTTLADIIDGTERASDLVVEASMGGVVAREVEEHRG